MLHAAFEKYLIIFAFDQTYFFFQVRISICVLLLDALVSYNFLVVELLNEIGPKPRNFVMRGLQNLIKSGCVIFLGPDIDGAS